MFSIRLLNHILILASNYSFIENTDYLMFPSSFRFFVFFLFSDIKMRGLVILSVVVLLCGQLAAAQILQPNLPGIPGKPLSI